MARVSIYLIISTQTEEAVNFYKSVFGSEFSSGIISFGNMPAHEGKPPFDFGPAPKTTLAIFPGTFI